MKKPKKHLRLNSPKLLIVWTIMDNFEQTTNDIFSLKISIFDLKLFSFYSGPEMPFFKFERTKKS